jgi:hypothetical protein
MFIFKNILPPNILSFSLTRLVQDNAELKLNLFSVGGILLIKGKFMKQRAEVSIRKVALVFLNKKESHMK